MNSDSNTIKIVINPPHIEDAYCPLYNIPTGFL